MNYASTASAVDLVASSHHHAGLRMMPISTGNYDDIEGGRKEGERDIANG